MMNTVYDANTTTELQHQESKNVESILTKLCPIHFYNYTLRSMNMAE